MIIFAIACGVAAGLFGVLWKIYELSAWKAGIIALGIGGLVWIILVIVGLWLFLRG